MLRSELFCCTTGSGHGGADSSPAAGPTAAAAQHQVTPLTLIGITPIAKPHSLIPQHSELKLKQQSSLHLARTSLTAEQAQVMRL